GNGNLTLTTSSLTVSGASITGGAFKFVRAPGVTTLSAQGTFSFFGVSLQVAQASLTLASAPAAAAITGTLVLQAPSGPIVLGGFTIGGTLKISFANTSSSISIDQGTVGVPGWGSIGITANISVPVQNGAFFQVVTPTNGIA